ncbi:MAG TPA: alpha/beta hydrolase [Miltoncostaeaceae bacterium]|nr:alpha/beta hydrolase [Miltoncostaeaceae bacterium]
MGVPIVLLHPFPLDATFWDPVAARLAVERPVHAPEFPGFGSTPTGGDEPSVVGWADAVAARIARSTTTGRAVVCGVSMGGYAALALAARHPERVAGLMLVATRADNDTEQMRRGRFESATAIELGQVDTFFEEYLPRLSAPGAEAVAERALRIARRQDPTAIAAALRALANRSDRTAQLAGMTMPALVMHGELDVPIPVAVAERMAGALPDARLVVLPGTGHLVPAERPQEFLQHAGVFLHRVDAAWRVH